VARITVEDCLRNVPNRFLLVNMVAKRVRQIREGSEYLVSAPKNEDIVVSLREIAAGKIKLKQNTTALEKPEESASALPEETSVENPDLDAELVDE
jgi:DNA-directed RNA polymerase subunit omega